MFTRALLVVVEKTAAWLYLHAPVRSFSKTDAALLSVAQWANKRLNPQDWAA